MPSPDFDLIPAIDLLDGQVVRLKKGVRTEKTVYSEDPVAFAMEFEAAGARRLHLVDLNGAFDGVFHNLALVRKIADATDFRIELGGGIRHLEDAEQAWDAGVHDVIIGTRAIEDPAFLERLLERARDRVIVGVDAKNGMVATRGWVESSDMSAVEFAEELTAMGCQRIIYTDIDTDGMLTGPNLAALRTMCETVTETEVVASGGVSRPEDIDALLGLEHKNLAGVVVGRAIYDGRVNLAEALAKIRARGR